MYRETPFVARLVHELHVRELLVLGSQDAYPEVDADSDTLHAVFYLLQEVGELPVRFRFKGAVSPYSPDLSEVFMEYNRNRDFWRQQAERGSLSKASSAALERLKGVVRDVPTVFEHSPPDYERWWFVFATYLFIAKSPLYARQVRGQPLEDIQRLLPEAFAPGELEAAAERVATLPLAASSSVTQ